MAGLRPLVVGNWKMNGLREEGLALAAGLAARAAGGGMRCDVALCPPFTLLHEVGRALAGGAIALGAQDCHDSAPGAHTGDIAAAMLADAGCRYVIVGHSERRASHGETDALVRRKAAAAQGAGLVPIVCVGETEAERDKGLAFEVIAREVESSLPESGETVVAYEPIWAIGTGRTPGADDIAAAHGHIRTAAAKARGRGPLRVLYGGSVNPRNAGEILRIPGVDGALVGGASLKEADFWAIVESCP